jgi:outer membrane protein assembly factor BamB
MKWFSHRWIAVAVASCLAGTVIAGDWPQFRGASGAGVADAAATPPTQFSPTKNVKWQVAAPPGFSSPVISQNTIFLTGFENGKLLTLAYEQETGKELWRVEAPATKIEPYHKTEGSPAASSCASDGQIVVSYFGSGGLFAYDLKGQLKWKFEMPSAKTGFDFGTGVSPIIVDGQVILLRDLPTDSKLFAIDAKTGSLTWETKREKFPTSWCTPAVWDTPDGKQLVVPGYGRMVGYSLKDGQEVWTVKGMPSACCTTPLVANGQLIFAGWSPGDDFKLPPFESLLKDDKGNSLDTDGDGKLSKKEAEKTFIGNFFDNNDTNKDGFITKEEWEAAGKFMSACVNSAFAVKPGGKGDISESHVVWRTKNKSVLPYVPSGIIVGDALYLIKDGGLLTSYNVKTGEANYESERVGSGGQYYASPVTANGKLYLTALNGDVQVVKLGDIPEVMYRGKLDERTAATPAIIGKTLYYRTATKLYAFEEGGK